MKPTLNMGKWYKSKVFKKVVVGGAPPPVAAAASAVLKDRPNIPHVRLK